MNEWNCHVQPHSTGFRAVISRVDRAAPYFLKQDGRALCFPTEEGAELAGLRHILHLLRTELRFTAPAATVATQKSAQEEAFGTVRSRKGKNSTVRRRQQRRAAKMKKAAG